jgi:BirA family biotin operon repressor/biotin-[acetyl-CoA-carboxylase] ligase
MLSEATVARALSRAGIDASVRFEEVTASTQASALELAAAGAPEWTFVGAGHQTEGRGRLDRKWIDEAGSGLLFSFVLRPIGLDPPDAGLLSLLAGSCMATAGSELSGMTLGCKWPNDVLVHDRKVGGILATSEISNGALRYAVIGIGVNLGGAPRDVAGAASLAGVDAAELLERFLILFRRGYSPGSASFAADVLEEYRDRCVTLGRRVRVEVPESVIEGTAVDLDEHGALLVETSVDRIGVAFGDVVHLD